MNVDQIIERIRDLQAQLDALGVASLGLFGSVARGEEREDGDVDILVALKGPATFDQHMDLELPLEDALGRRVDLVTVTGPARGTSASSRPRTAPCRVIRGSISRTCLMPLTFLRLLAGHELISLYSRKMIL